MKIPNKRELKQITSNHSSDFINIILRNYFNFQWMILLCCQIIHFDLGRTYYKMSISEKVKTIDKKIEGNKAQYSWDRQIPKISAFSSGNVSKYEFLTSKG